MKFLLLLSTILSSFVMAQTSSDFDKIFYPEGPNCFNTSLRSEGVMSVVRYVHDSEFMQIIKNQCKLITDKELISKSTKPILGVVIETTGIEYQPLKYIHSFTQFKDGVTISKADFHTENPTYIKDINYEMQTLQVDPACILFNPIRTEKNGPLMDKKDLYGCKKILQYYDCHLFDESLLREDIKKLAFEQKSSEKEISKCVLNPKSCDLKTLEKNNSGINEKIFQLRRKIETDEGYESNKNYDDIRRLEIIGDSLFYQIKLLKGETII